jgi:SagB-type dehydrogenase family enzyme
MEEQHCGDALDTVMRYHEQTKHHFHRFARSLGYMDWANQPDPFRRYAGAELIALPLPGTDDAPASPCYEDLYRPGAVASVAPSVVSLSRLLECSLAITAWKQAGTTRWALRANPSSGNLHPTESYVLIGELAGLASEPGLYHYAAKEHALERRASWSDEAFATLLRPFPRDAFLVGFSSVNWRETWKYGERAFRYCQHDVGHAIGAVRIAAQMLGWRMLLLDGASDDSVAALLGIDRAQDFEGAEREHPDALAVVWPVASSSDAAPRVHFSLTVDATLMKQVAWYGKANRLSRDDPQHWDILDDVEAAARKPASETQPVELKREPSSTPGESGPPSAAQVIHERRSALAFDGKTSIAARDFYTMLARVMPHADRKPCERPMPWDALPWEATIHLALFVHRVDDLEPGLYLLARDPAKAAWLRQAMYSQYLWAPPAGCPPELPLFLLEAGDVRRLAAELSCGQDIAGDSAFSLGMIAEFESSLRRHGAWFYRRLYWETGVIGQVLYLEACSRGVGATGIGCFFDDPVHQVLGLRDAAFQSLYHFTTGGPVEDPRLTTLPPYGLDH